jgi:hypothetical protein
MNNKQLAIFGFQRSGTKLLADIFQQQGYHNFGEFFNPKNNYIENLEIPVAKRVSIESQRSMVNDRKLKSEDLFFYEHFLIINQRIEIFRKFNHISPSIVTVWFENYLRFPTLFSEIDNRFFLCTRRKNRFEQLLSRSITLINLNHNNEISSKAVKINLTRFENEFSKLCRVEMMQNLLVESNKGMLIDFDELITGKTDLGFDYSVNSEDQHSSDELYNLIINLDEVQNKFKELEIAYGAENTNYGIAGLG